MRRLFIEGDTGLGKSQMLREILAPYAAQVGGFYVQRVYKGGITVAFAFKSLLEDPHIVLRTDSQEFSDWERVFLFCGEDGSWQTRKEVFEIYGVACLEKSLKMAKEAGTQKLKRLILLDEIGGVELSCQLFADMLERVLDGPVPVLGVIKSRRNLGKLKDRLSAGEERPDPRPLDERIRRSAETELIEMTKDNRDLVRAKADGFVRAALSG